MTPFAGSALNHILRTRIDGGKTASAREMRAETSVCHVSPPIRLLGAVCRPLALDARFLLAMPRKVAALTIPCVNLSANASDDVRCSISLRLCPPRTRATLGAQFRGDRFLMSMSIPSLSSAIGKGSSYLHSVRPGFIQCFNLFLVSAQQLP